MADGVRSHRANKNDTDLLMYQDEVLDYLGNEGDLVKHGKQLIYKFTTVP